MKLTNLDDIEKGLNARKGKKLVGAIDWSTQLLVSPLKRHRINDGAPTGVRCGGLFGGIT